MKSFLSPEWLSLLIFTLCYLLFILLPAKRAWTACIGGGLLVITGVLPLGTTLRETISWNVIALFLGTLVLANLFLKSRVPSLFAEWLVSHAPSTRTAMVALCALAGIISIFVENVAVVLLVAPVALSLAKRLKISPVSLMIGIAISSNVQGTATMIGDPPSMILASQMHLGFWDFFIYEGRPSIFFAIQAGFLAALATLFFMLRNLKGRLESRTEATARSWTPTLLLALLIAGLSFASTIDPAFTWFAGSYTLLLALTGLVWYRYGIRWGRIGHLVKGLDWDTAFFLVGVFVLAGGVAESGWLDKLGLWMSTATGESPLLAFLLLVGFAVLVSGFVDNVPFLLVMIPVAGKLSATLQAPEPLMMFGLLIGACLGGNITPIGGSANVVALGILRERDEQVSFPRFMRISIPFTLAALVAGCLAVWLAYGMG